MIPRNAAGTPLTPSARMGSSSMSRRLLVAAGVATLLGVAFMKWMGSSAPSEPDTQSRETQRDPIEATRPTDLITLRLEETPGWASSLSDANHDTAENTATVFPTSSNTGRTDNWDSETANDEMTAFLRDLLKAEPDDAAVMLAPDFRCTELRPSNRRLVYENGTVRLERATRNEPNLLPEAGFAVWSDAWAAFKDGKKKSKVKVVSLALNEDNTRRATVLVSGSSSETSPRLWQWNAEWICRWSRSEPAKLVSIHCRSYAEANLTRSLSKTPLFGDFTASVFGHLDHYDGQIQTGIEHWASRLSRIDEMVMTGHHGLAVGDVNGDGLDDLYLCDAGGLTNRLYLKTADGTVEDRSHASGVDFLEDSRAALLVDLDNDGDQDLVVSMLELIVFAENDGNGRFTVRGGFTGSPNAYTMSAADFNNDGYLDIYVCVYGPHEKETGTRGFEARSPTPFYDANNGGANVLLRNHGEFRFSDATEESKLDTNNRRWSFSSAWEDYDRDGDPDLYVANDFGRNCFYENRNGVFVDVAAAKGVEDQAAGMSVAWGDYNGDGRSDLYVGNMFSAAGQRVTYQREFARLRSTEESRQGLQRMARGNTLFVGSTNGFADATTNTGVAMGRWAWSSGFADIDNNGWQDIVIANGYLTNSRSAPDL